jgi:uncharacterized protein (DUF2141 family)
MKTSHRTALVASFAGFTAAIQVGFAPPARAADAALPPAGCAVLELQGVRPGQGQLMINVFGSAETFGKKPMASLRVPAGAEATQRVTACGLDSAREIAVMMFQDLNGDGQMARNVLGIPSEPWGSSGKPGSFGPSWETGRVALDGTRVTVQLSK